MQMDRQTILAMLICINSQRWPYSPKKEVVK